MCRSLSSASARPRVPPPLRVGIVRAASEASLVLPLTQDPELLGASLLDARVEAFAIESRSGFRPSALDPGSRDDRELGVLVRARPAFD